jgi:hypothetical protein
MHGRRGTVSAARSAELGNLLQKLLWKETCETVSIEGMTVYLWFKGIALDSQTNRACCQAKEAVANSMLCIEFRNRDISPSQRANCITNRRNQSRSNRLEGPRKRKSSSLPCSIHRSSSLCLPSATSTRTLSRNVPNRGFAGGDLCSTNSPICLFEFRLKNRICA